MKTTIAFLAASVAEAFIIPDQQQLSALAELPLHSYHENAPEPSDNILSREEEASFIPHIAEMAAMTEGLGCLMANYPQGAGILPPDQDLEDIEYGDDGNDGWDEDFFIQPQSETHDERGHHPGHRHFNMTLYEMINTSTHTKTFARLVSEFYDVADILKSTSSKHTVFVPTDKAFEKLRYHHPNLPDKVLKKVIMYHIMPHEYSRRELFFMNTIPTMLENTGLGPYPQRICTQFGPKGLTLNFYASIIKGNLYGTNGVAHGLNSVLLPPFTAIDALNTRPSTFSTFELGLYKTGLFDNIEDKSTHSGATFFVPTNRAFKKLGHRVTSVLFSRRGEKYLEAILKYHIVYNHTLYSDDYNKPKKDEGLNPASVHIDLPTLLLDRHISVDIARFGRFVTLKLNGFTSVAMPDLVTQDGVIHILNKVLLPPCRPESQTCEDGGRTIQHSFLDDDDDDYDDDYDYDYDYDDDDDDDDDNAWENLTVEDLIERLEPYVEK
ncbi:hypothetical protein, variant [Blastomyces dermatitidis ATCC 26199]|nr:hypothetical protein BDFG_02983 [Blastomyces dermatitidis ATCC 26199]EQL35228.1 hypothetical protein, variant [Blastomyces dermatitidis ATCC 26199]